MPLFFIGFIFLFISIIPCMAMTLSRDGIPACTILVDENAIPAEKTAASELVNYLEKITGSQPAIQAQSGAETNIYVGRSAASDALVPDVDWTALGTDGIVIKTVGNNLILSGGRPRGAIYAVYTFLQDYLGCRWYAIDAEEVIPQKSTLEINDINLVYRPPFIFREYYTETLKNPKFAVKMRQNGREFADEIPEDFGGSVLMGNAHTLLRIFLKPDKYFADHPQWYAFDKATGERKPKAICFTAPGTREMVIQEMNTMLEGRPEINIVSVSCDDSPIICECEACENLRTREGGESGPLLDFVNAVAEGITKTHPDLIISTLAYWRTDRPPDTLKLHPNVQIQLGVLDRNHKHAIPDVPHFNHYTKRWSELTSHLYIWDYDPHFANFIQPHPNHFVAGKSLRFYRDNGVTGVFTQGAWGSTGEFMHMRTWVTSQLMWNPDLDDRTLITEFLNAYYGAAGKYLLDYLDLINAAINRDPALWLGVYDATTRHWLTLEDLNTATRLFDSAEAAVAGDVTLSYRVHRTRLSIDVVWIERYRELLQTSVTEGRTFLGPKDPYAALDKIEQNEFKSDTYREWADYSEYMTKLREIFPRREGNIPVECDGLEPSGWEEIQEKKLTVSPEGSGQIIDDSSASNGKALELKGREPSLEARYKLPAQLTGRWRVYVVLRAEAEVAPAAVVAGIYAWNMPDGSANEISRVSVPCSTQYQTVDLGVHRLIKDATIQVQPNGIGSYGEVKAVRVDRIFLVRAQ